MALLVCDLDDFKRINDLHGHVVGDRVLVRFGQLLRELARQGDVAMRLGGEEFCVVLPRTDRAGALAAAERLRIETAIRMHDLVAGGVTVSVGVANTSRGVPDARGLLAAADRGLYAAKAAGRDASSTPPPECQRTVAQRQPCPTLRPSCGMIKQIPFAPNALRERRSSPLRPLRLLIPDFTIGLFESARDWASVREMAAGAGAAVAPLADERAPGARS